MSSKPIIIVCGEPQSVFFEIFFKTIKKLNIKRFKTPLLLITSNSILYENFKKFKINFKTNDIDEKLINLKKDELNIINIPYNNFSFKKKITIQSNIFMSNIGMYSFEYGIIFIIFLFLLFTIDLKINYLNIMLLFSCLFVLQSSVSFAFPLIWFIISLTKKRSGFKHA